MTIHEWTVPGDYSFASDHHVVQFFTGTDTSDDGNCVGSLTFQDGPVAEHSENGTTNEEVISALLERLKALNRPPYACEENDRAIDHLVGALSWLERRTRKRAERGVEGTSIP